MSNWECAECGHYSPEYYLDGTGQTVENDACEVCFWDRRRLPEEGLCCLCGGRYIFYGCDPYPVRDGELERCCHACDNNVVFPARQRLADSIVEGDGAAVKWKEEGF